MDGNNNFFDGNREIISNYEEPKPDETIMGKLSFIFGIIGLVLAASVCCSGMGLPFGIAALVLGIIGKNKASEDGKAKLGFIFGIICLALALAGIILSLTLNIGSSVLQYLNH